jgi:hypothetical protein
MPGPFCPAGKTAAVYPIGHLFLSRATASLAKARTLQVADRPRSAFSHCRQVSLVGPGPSRSKSG